MQRAFFYLCGLSVEWRLAVLSTTRYQKAKPMPPRLRIGLDARTFSCALTGIVNYAYHIIRSSREIDASLEFLGYKTFSLRELDEGFFQALHHSADKKAKHQLSADLSEFFGQAKSRLVSHLSQIAFARTLYNAARHHQFNRLMERRPFDIFHAYNYVPPSDPGVVVLPVVYDLSFVRYPETHPKERIKLLERLPQVIEQAPFIQTISQFSKGELLDVFRCDPDKVFVAPPAASPVFQPEGEEACRADLARWRLRYGEYFLSVGTLEPRKNLATLISAYSRLTASSQSHFPLVVVGGEGWGNLKLPPQTAALVRQCTIRFVGRVKESQLRSLYEGARLLLFPSIYEGFGMPVVEALACGTPVAYSAGTAMDEIASEVGQRASATDVVAWTNLLEIAMDGDSHRSLELQWRRISRAHRFSWQKSALQVIEIYRKLS
jgi:alpha-1,3-rhamnosyl/mannosyltransferase